MAGDRARVALVTGVAGGMPARVAARLRERGVSQVIGVDTVPHPAIGGARFVSADLAADSPAELIRRFGIDTVVHLADGANPAERLLAACRSAPGVRCVVVGSTAEVYGRSWRTPAMYTEDDGIRPTSPAGRDAERVEAIADRLAGERPDIVVSVLRPAVTVGRGVRSAVLRYLTGSVATTVLGYDPRLQFLHVDDLVELIAVAARHPVPGTFNVAAPGVVPLSQALRLARTPALPVARPLLGAVGGLFGRFGVAGALDETVLTRELVIDPSRACGAFGWRPVMTGDAALRDAVAAHRSSGGRR